MHLKLTLRIGLLAIGQAFASEDYGVASVSDLAPALSTRLGFVTNLGVDEGARIL